MRRTDCAQQMKRMLACLFAGMLVLGGLPVSALAEQSDESAIEVVDEPDVAAEGDSDEESDLASTYMPDEIEPGTIDDFEQVPSVHDGNEGDDLATQASLPSAYDSRDYGYITPVRAQGRFGTCWAFGTIAAAEAYLLRQGPNLGYTADTLDLSERHLAYFTYHVPEDPLHNTDGDQLLPRSDGSRLNSKPPCYLNTMGSAWLTANALWSQCGAVLEEDANYEVLFDWATGVTLSPVDGKYDYSRLLEGTALDSSLGRKGVARLKGMRMVSMADTEEVKQSVMDYGALAVAYYMDYSYLKNGYNGGGTYATYYYDGSSGTNHIVAIVGWDDSVSPSSFGTKPKSSGAWICKNSYGEAFGKGGYFLLSYEDACLKKQNAFGYAMEEDGKYENLYLYDGSSAAYYNYLDSGGSIATVFDAKANASGEELEAVSVFLPDVNVTYACQIYLDPTDASDPTSGVPALCTPMTGKFTYAGINRLELPAPVTLAPGVKFSVVFTLSHAVNDTQVKYAVDANCDDFYRAVSAVSPGQSFERDSSASPWEDLALVTSPDEGDEPTCCARIKAHTNNVNLGTKLLVSNATVDAIADQIYTGSALTPKPKVVIANHTLVEGTDYTLSYQNNSAIGTARVTITGSGSYSGSKTVTFNIARTISISEATVSAASALFYTGSALRPEPTVVLSGATLTKGTDYTVSYRNNVNEGTATITVTGRGAYTGTAKTTFLIAPAFIDVSSSTAHAEDIAWLAGMGISTGWDGDNGTRTFRPLSNVKRCDMAAFLFRLAKQWGVVSDSYEPKPATMRAFTDVNTSTAHYKEVLWLAETGISTGWKVGSKAEFRPLQDVTRSQMAAFMYRLATEVAEKKGTHASGPGFFYDVNSATTFHDEIWWLAGNGVSEGWTVGTRREYRPNTPVKRSDMAAFLHRLYGV